MQYFSHKILKAGGIIYEDFSNYIAITHSHLQSHYLWSASKFVLICTDSMTFVFKKYKGGIVIPYSLATCLKDTLQSFIKELIMAKCIYRTFTMRNTRWILITNKRYAMSILVSLVYRGSVGFHVTATGVQWYLSFT